MNKWKIGLLTLLAIGYGGASQSQTLDERVSELEKNAARQKYIPQIHGILRGKYEYEPMFDRTGSRPNRGEMGETQRGAGASRFEVRNARLSAEGNLPLRSSYKLEVDLCDESAIKMKDAWVRINPWRTLRITLGQQRMPFSIDAHRNPSAQYFANRSFIAKQVGDMRDVGVAIGYDIISRPRGKTGEGLDKRKILSIDAGIYNGSNLDNQKSAWFTSPAYSARVQYFPIKGLALIPSVQHQLIAGREASYTSFDFGAYYETGGFHIEAEYLRKFYAKDTFDDCNAVDVMTIYKIPMKKGFLGGISYLLRYDYMDNHSDGKAPLQLPPLGGEPKLQLSDAERHRLTAGLTFHVANRYFPTDIRLNYEKYWYPHSGTPKESEQDKLVAELAIRF